MPLDNWKIPFGQGVGRVEAFGPDASSDRFKLGDRVVGVMWSRGTWQQLVAVPEHILASGPSTTQHESCCMTRLGILPALSGAAWHGSHTMPCNPAPFLIGRCKV